MRDHWPVQPLQLTEAALEMLSLAGKEVCGEYQASTATAVAAGSADATILRCNRLQLPALILTVVYWFLITRLNSGISSMRSVALPDTAARVHN